MNPLKLESTTFHYSVEAPERTAPDAWPDLTKQYSTSLHYRPDHLSFDVHVTHDKHQVRVQNVRSGGLRVLKDGLSEHRVSEDFSTDTVPQFVVKYIELALARHAKR